jgi:hypothetical protein
MAMINHCPIAIAVALDPLPLQSPLLLPQSSCPIAIEPAMKTEQILVLASSMQAVAAAAAASLVVAVVLQHKTSSIGVDETVQNVRTANIREVFCLNRTYMM